MRSVAPVRVLPQRLELLDDADPAPQLLILDEPMNNLDLDSVAQLVDALDGYPAPCRSPATTSSSCPRSA